MTIISPAPLMRRQFFSEPLSEGDIQDVMGGLGQYATAVDSYGKLAVTWASIKAQ